MLNVAFLVLACQSRAEWTQTSHWFHKLELDSEQVQEVEQHTQSAACGQTAVQPPHPHPEVLCTAMFPRSHPLAHLESLRTSSD